MDNTILHVALPALVSDLGAATSQLQWIVDAYLVFAGLLLTGMGMTMALATKSIMGSLPGPRPAWARP